MVSIKMPDPPPREMAPFSPLTDRPARAGGAVHDPFDT
jgi:hypothetical protein